MGRRDVKEKVGCEREKVGEVRLRRVYEQAKDLFIHFSTLQQQTSTTNAFQTSLFHTTTSTSTHHHHINTPSTLHQDQHQNQDQHQDQHQHNTNNINLRASRTFHGLQSMITPHLTLSLSYFYRDGARRCLFSQAVSSIFRNERSSEV